MDETTKEIAKTTSKVLEVAEKVGSFLGTVLGDAFKEVGASIHDRTKLYRYKNLLKINDKVIQLHKERGIQGKSVPIQPSIGIPLIEAASLSEDGKNMGVRSSFLTEWSKCHIEPLRTQLKRNEMGIRYGSTFENHLPRCLLSHYFTRQ